MTNLFDLSGRVALVTGSAQGMGRAMALALAEAGADLVLLDRNAAGIEATAHSAQALNRRTLAITGDVTDTDHIDRVFAAVDREFGRVDVLGNVAGEARMGAAEHMSLTDIQATFHNLVISRYYTCQCAGRRMLARGKGSIVSIGSIAGVSSLGRSQSVYGMAMAAVVQMTRELSTEWAPRGVRVNCILPAQVLGANGLGPRMDADPWLRETFLRGIPAGRFGKPDDIKGLAVLLASDAADWITGAAIPMDGGNLAMNAGAGLLAPLMERYGANRP
ncbi:MAG TPA: SDR family NAD(P)-dependent oxidoreductase [Acetobacteraceae bacterium]|jgi:NAD(P)-dependent dehydrogenase (short-subunit alcohol dehydrogenase family)|nr:SDR family NAD(P)-dependent oxidoreductase [Acetobacteraceae bacterium]